MGTKRRPDWITGLKNKTYRAESIRLKFLLLIVAVGVVVSLVACSNAASVQPSPTSTSSVNKYGGTFKFLSNDTATLMGYPPTASQTGAFYAGFCLEGLIRVTDKPFIYAPALATSWDLAPDKSSYTFHLRKGVKFSDGSDFNATVVKWNIDNCIKAKRTEIAMVASVDVVDDYTVKVNLSSWDSVTLFQFSGGLTSMASKAAYEKNGEDWVNLNPIGTGPFIFTEMERSQYTKFVKNPNYWDKGLPYLDAIEIDVAKDPTTLQALLLKGGYDGALQTDAITATNVLQAGNYAANLGAMGNFIWWYNDTDPASCWSNIKMRQALEYAIDKQQINDAFGKGFTHVSNEIIGGIWETPGNNPGTTPRKYDPVKAAQLVKDAGFPDGISTTLEVNTQFNGDFIVAMQNMLAKAGIKIAINLYPTNVMQEKALQPTPPNFLRYTRARGGPFDMLTVTNADMITGSIKYPGTRRPDGFDTLLKATMQETDGNKLLANMNKLEQLAYNDVMFVPVYVTQDVNIWAKNVKSDQATIMFNGGRSDAGAARYVYLEK